MISKWQTFESLCLASSFFIHLTYLTLMSTLDLGWNALSVHELPPVWLLPPLPLPPHGTVYVPTANFFRLFGRIFAHRGSCATAPTGPNTPFALGLYETYLPNYYSKVKPLAFLFQTTGKAKGKPSTPVLQSQSQSHEAPLDGDGDEKSCSSLTCLSLLAYA